MKARTRQQLGRIRRKISRFAGPSSTVNQRKSTSSSINSSKISTRRRQQRRSTMLVNRLRHYSTNLTRSPCSSPRKSRPKRSTSPVSFSTFHEKTYPSTQRFDTIALFCLFVQLVTEDTASSQTWMNVLKMFLVLAVCAGQVYMTTSFFNRGNQGRRMQNDINPFAKSSI